MKIKRLCCMLYVVSLPLFTNNSLGRRCHRHRHRYRAVLPGARATGLAVKLLLDLVLGAPLHGSAPGTSATASTEVLARGRGAAGRMAPAVERGRGFLFAGCRLMLFLGGAPDLGPGAVGVVSPALAGGGEDAQGDGFVHDRLFRGEVRWRGQEGMYRYG